MGAAEHVRSDAADRLEIVDAVLAAMGRRGEVLEVVASCPDREHALDELGRVLGVSVVGAGAVLDVQLYRFTHAERTRLEAIRGELRRLLDTPEESFE